MAAIKANRAHDLSRFRLPTGAAFAAQTQRGRSIVDGNVFSSKGVHVAVVIGPAIFSREGQKLYDLRGVNIYKLNGDLVGHLSDIKGAEKHLDKATDRLFHAS